MKLLNVRLALLSLPIACLLLPAPVLAQTTVAGGIAGLVRDTSGGVLPGVTVQVASPALIEQTREAFTDGQGRYAFVNLLAGTYSVTFSLSGFNTLNREGIELTTGFTATVNADMPVGALEETITVTAASPVVDTQNVRSQTVLTRVVLDALPTGKTTAAFAALTVGASTWSVGGVMQDVGGSRGEQYGSVLIHGSRHSDGKNLFDGMRYNNLLQNGSGGARWWNPNQNAVNEVVLETSGLSAESETGGVQSNIIPKDGGNLFTYSFVTAYTGRDLQNENLTPALIARGLTMPTHINQIYDIGGGAGGPIAQNKLWYYAAVRKWGSQEDYAGVFWNKAQGQLPLKNGPAIEAPAGTEGFYVPDETRPYFFNVYNRDLSIRLTYQANAKHRFTGYFGNQYNCQCLQIGGSGFRRNDPGAAANHFFVPNALGTATWTYAASNRLLLDAGAARLVNFISTRRSAETGIDDISIVEQSTGFLYNAASYGVTSVAHNEPAGTDVGQYNQRFNVNYVTGSHAVKIGVQTLFGRQNYPGNEVNGPDEVGPVHYYFLNGRPSRIRQWASPGSAFQKVKNMSVFAQDQWTLNRMTLNYGMRFDWVNGTVPAQTRLGGLWLKAFEIAEIKNVPNFKDINYRMGGAYDLFGDGKTALKGSIGRYVGAEGTNLTANVNPATAIATNTFRNWTDNDHDFYPDCNLANFAAQSPDTTGSIDTCGAISNNRFGTSQVSNIFKDEVLGGWGNRQYNWQLAATVQQELASGVSFTGGYFRTWFGNFLATTNLLADPTQYDPFCVTVPVDPGLPGGGGNVICDGLGDVNVARFGGVLLERSHSSNFGKQQEVYDGIDATIVARLGNGKLIQGGMNTGRTRKQCVVTSSPVQYCKNTPPFWHPQIKLSGVYPLPVWGLQASATVQNLPGSPYTATRIFTNAEIAPSLGRDLSSGPNGVKAVAMIEPNTQFEGRLSQVDVRLTKTFQIGSRGRLQGQFDIYNILNDDSVLAQTNSYGRNWRLPTQVLAARLFKFGAQIDF